MASNRDTPKYDRPPVNEVAIGAQFQALGEGAFELAQIASRLQGVLHDVGSVVEKAPLPPIHAKDQPRGISLQLVDKPDPPLFWLIDKSDQYLVQLQQNRLVLNWRKLKPGDDYPSFDSLRPMFENAWQMLQTAAQELGLDAPVPNACEVTYFNAIDVTDLPGSAAQLLVAPWSGTCSDDYLPEPAELRLSVAYDLPQESGQLTIEVAPGVHQALGSDAILMRVSAQGWPATEDTDGMMRFLDAAHEAIVRGFTSFTTDDMHKQWGRRP